MLWNLDTGTCKGNNRVVRTYVIASLFDIVRIHIVHLK